MIDSYKGSILRMYQMKGSVVDSARSPVRDRSTAQRLDDELMAIPDRGCKHSKRCLDCTRIVCKDG